MEHCFWTSVLNIFLHAALFLVYQKLVFAFVSRAKLWNIKGVLFSILNRSEFTFEIFLALNYEFIYPDSLRKIKKYLIC